MEQKHIISVQEREVKYRQLLLREGLFLQDEVQLNVVEKNGTVKESFLLTKREFLKFPQIEKSRVLRLDSLRKSAATCGGPSPEVSCINMDISIESTKKEEHVSLVKRPLFLEEVDMNGLALYISLLFDHHLLKEELHNYIGTHTEKLWKYTKRSDLKDFPYIFIALIIAIEPLLIQESFMIKLWLEVEMFHFRRSLSSLSYRESFENVLTEHIDRMKDYESVSQNWQHSSWPREMWAKCETQYSVSSYWLITMGQVSYKRDPSRKGFVLLEERIFLEGFLPCLYEKYLLDLCEILRYQTLVKPSDYGEWYGFTKMKELKSEFIEYGFNSYESTSTPEMYDFNMRVSRNHTSPITKLFMSVEGLEDLVGQKKRVQRGKNKLFQESGLPSNMIDIEDLFQKPDLLMPPCLVRLVEKSQKDWCKYKDRWTLVKYLIDMGYEEGIVDIMSVNRNNAYDKSQVDAIVKSYKKKKEEKEGGVISVYCGTLINGSTSKEEIVRCPYEEAVNGNKRVESSVEEKQRYTSQCACSIGMTTGMNHPLDYIQQKVLSLNTNKRKK